jgi:glycosyltransferase involved in cell wall biosynthesis
MTSARGGTRVGVNASVVGRNPTGLGVYAIKLLGELDQRREDLVGYTSCPEAFPSLKVRIGRAPVCSRPDYSARGHVLRALWVQSLLRLKARVAGVTVLLNSVPEGIEGSSMPQITVVHDLLPLRFPAEYPRQQYSFRLLVPRVLRASTMVMADSESTRLHISERYGVPLEKIRIIHPAYDATVYRREVFDDSPGGDRDAYVLYVRNLLPHKNLLRPLDAVAILRRRRRCRLVSRGHGRPVYVRAVRERVETLGWMTRCTACCQTARCGRSFGSGACVGRRRLAGRGPEWRSPEWSTRCQELGAQRGWRPVLRDRNGSSRRVR